MTILAIYPDAGGDALEVTRDYQAITETLRSIGVLLERWPVRDIADEADAER